MSVDAALILEKAELSPGLQIRTNNPVGLRAIIRAHIQEQQKIHPEAFRWVAFRTVAQTPMMLYLVNLSHPEVKNAQAG